ncbi:MAG TPA: hypothetical protein VMR45_03615 [Patescibacteria group bacterium]|nr:hypothetical protein [Patescibacteria group bacterium]
MNPGEQIGNSRAELAATHPVEFVQIAQTALEGANSVAETVDIARRTALEAVRLPMMRLTDGLFDAHEHCAAGVQLFEEATGPNFGTIPKLALSGYEQSVNGAQAPLPEVARAYRGLINHLSGAQRAAKKIIELLGQEDTNLTELSAAQAAALAAIDTYREQTGF